MVDIAQLIGGARFHALTARDAAYVAYQVAKDGRDLHLTDLLVHAAILADFANQIRAQRPDLTPFADREIEKWRAQHIKNQSEGARANG